MLGILVEREREREREREIPDEWCHVFIISHSEEDVACLELVDEVDSEEVGWEGEHVTKTC